jgi:hypothetical protein
MQVIADPLAAYTAFRLCPLSSICMLVLQRIRMSRVSIAQSMRVDRKRIWNRSRSDWKAILAVIASEEVNALIIVKKQSLRVKARSLQVRSDFEVISLRYQYV